MACRFESDRWYQPRNIMKTEDAICEIINKASKTTGCKGVSWRVQKFSNFVTDKTFKGVYAIYEGSIVGNGPVIYVGKGKIATRIANHRRKARKDLKPPKYIPEGWKWLREHQEYDIEKWDVWYMPLNDHPNCNANMTALEGVLIKEYKPKANDETFHDRTII